MEEQLVKAFVELRKTQKIVLKCQLRNLKKICNFDIVSHKIHVKWIPALKIFDPRKYVHETNFKFEKLFSLEAKSAKDDPNFYDDERHECKKWWKEVMNGKEINAKLATKRKKYFSWKYRYDMIVGEFKQKSRQWKLSFLNSNINSIPQNDSIKKDNIKRLIRCLKLDNLYDDWKDELDEFFEFENYVILLLC
jgi:hypothetical protein